MSKLMSVKKQWELNVGDYVVMEGVEKPGIVNSVDVEDSDHPTQVKYYRDGSDTELMMWNHPAIIRRFPRVGERVLIKTRTDRDSHCYCIGDIVTVQKVDIDGGQELFCRNDSGVTSWVYETGVKRVKKGKAPA